MSCFLYFQFWFIFLNLSVRVISQILGFLVCLTRLGFSCLSVWFAHCKLWLSYYKPAMPIYFLYNSVFTVNGLPTIYTTHTHALYFLFYSNGQNKAKLSRLCLTFLLERYFVLCRFKKNGLSMCRVYNYC